ncbi:ZIP family metal transporter [Candidatus Kaiserbacteria bacterium CG_4_8_14_3_um_filter_38_9]|uniref:ZIP family metal transporter n=1 Tax=Candidatus Kaiserbacteria bacterium CG_4_8_14_3_um_filter_38_9 TaxID=1974599 RepID=A0A2M7IN47_9BACT|nr:MAG: ZIP family metal transporter [Candidatus Kaiserbacteria bacterium CG_4_8_14_3_um_filter_38_9]
MIIFFTLISVLIISLISFIGVLALVLKRDLLNKSIFILVSLAVGALLGDVFIHIIPEAYDKIAGRTNVAFLLIVGILIFFILEKFIHWHHHTLEHADEYIHQVGMMILLGDGVHNFIDGLIIASSYMVSFEVGIATTIAVILHEIPQEIGNFGVLIHAGYKAKKALWCNFLSALTALIGAIVALILGGTAEEFAVILLPVTAGGFIYIALSDLIPELHKNHSEQSLVQVIAIMVGVMSMAVILLFAE